MDRLLNLGIGTAGISAMEATDAAMNVNLPSDGTDAGEIIKIVVQLIIGVITILGILKKKERKEKRND